MKIFLLIALALLLGGCSFFERDDTGWPTRQTLVWEDTRFDVGMSQQAALQQLSGAVTHEAFDPERRATIIGAPGPDASWVLQFVSPEPVGPMCIARLSFTSGTLSKIEIVDTAQDQRRTSYGYPSREELTWKATTLRVGMTRQAVLDRLGQEQPPDAGSVYLPPDHDVQASVWAIGFTGPPMIGNGMWVRLTFDGQALDRIQITAVLQ